MEGNDGGMSDHLTRLEKYVADYIDAPSWGGPTQYPPTPDIEDFKAIRDDLKLLEELRDLFRRGVSNFGAHSNQFEVELETPTAAQMFYKVMYRVAYNEPFKSLGDEETDDAKIR